MGGNQSKNETAVTIGNMKLYLAKSEYYPGDVVTGNVILNVTADNIYCDAIIVRFKASEQMTYKGSTQKPLAIKDQVAAIIPVRQNLSRGASTFPFTYDLPQRLQPSTYVNGQPNKDAAAVTEQKPEDITFTLMYLLVAEVEFKSKDILDLQAVNIMKIATVQNNQPISETFQSKLSGCLGGGSGMYRQKISISQSEFNPGDNIPITLDIVNSGKLPLQRMVIQIIREQTMISSGEINKTKTLTMAEKKIQVGVLGGSQKTNLKYTIDIPRNSQLILPTFQGGCFICRYWVQFKFIYNAPFCSSVESVQKVPFTIISATDRQVTKAPQNRIN